MENCADMCVIWILQGYRQIVSWKRPGRSISPRLFCQCFGSGITVLNLYRLPAGGILRCGANCQAAWSHQGTAKQLPIRNTLSDDLRRFGWQGQRAVSAEWAPRHGSQKPRHQTSPGAMAEQHVSAVTLNHFHTSPKNLPIT